MERRSIYLPNQNDEASIASLIVGQSDTTGFANIKHFNLRRKKRRVNLKGSRREEIKLICFNEIDERKDQ